jgi:hypothetical protein
VAIAESNWSFATQSIDHALAALKRGETPISAWQVHAVSATP